MLRRRILLNKIPISRNSERPEPSWRRPFEEINQRTETLRRSKAYLVEAVRFERTCFTALTFSRSRCLLCAEPREDIPMLVEYFVKRSTEKAGKQICKIDNNTLDLCQSYPWPGNIRELHNIAEHEEAQVYRGAVAAIPF